MFGNLFSNAINTVKSFLGGNKSAVKPTPAPKPKAMVAPQVKITPIATLPKIAPIVAYNPYIASWGDSKATINDGIAKNNSAEVARLAAVKAREEEYARAKKAAAQHEFDTIKNEFFNLTKQIAVNHQKGQEDSFWSKVTGGFSSENSTRDFAQKQLEDLQNNQVVRYDKKLNNFLTEQAKRKAEIEKQKFATQAEFDAAVGIFTKWENEQIDDLEYTRAASTGMAEAWGEQSQKAGKSGIAKAGSWFNDKVVQPVAGNPIFKYTLGAGDENTPSLITAPARGLTALTNLFRKPGDAIYDRAGNESKYNGNPWTTTFNQSNLNGKAATLSFDDYTRNKYLKMVNPNNEKLNPKASTLPDEFKVGYKPGQKVPSPKFDQAAYDKWKKENEKSLKSEWEKDVQRTKDAYGFANEIAADPLSYATGGTGKLGKWAGAAAKGAKEASAATKAGKQIFKFTDKIAQSKPVKMLFSEAKTPDQKFADAYASAKKGTDDLQRGLAPRIDAINAKLAGKDKIDTSILDELSTLTDSEAAILQRMVNGKFAFSDRLKLRDIRGLQGGMGAQREKLQDIADRWGVFAEKMKNADDIADQSTRFGRGKKDSFYSPRIDYAKDNAVETYNFAAKKKINTRKNPQSAADLARNARERYILSNSGNVEAGKLTAERSKWAARRDSLSKEYETRASALRAGVRDADKKRGTIFRYVSERRAGRAPTTSLGRSVFNTAGNIAGLPVKAWKKSVLNYRPAWTVNNVGYNLQASALAGGGNAIAESVKMLRPKNFRKAMSEVPDSVKADLTGELGSAYKGKNPFKRFDSKLNRGYSNIENFSRVAAFRGAKSKGLTDEQALKRVNNYMFDYKTKNWERPFKAVVPFWGWSKNLTKASIRMPFDNPRAGVVYNQVDQHQNEQFDRDFEKTVPELLALGYTEQEIEDIKAEQSKYYKGKLKIGDMYINTPFNAFSDRGLSGVGFNPYMTAVSESATATDSFGRKIGGTDALLKNRVLSKFPQYELGKKGVSSWRVATGIDKPKQGWIGEKGSEGYGLSKERQGSDPTKANYDSNLDPRAKLGQDALAFVGVPRGVSFDTKDLIERKKLNKATSAYFDLDTKGMNFTDAEAARQGVFKKYGITEDEFYKGVLSKYDTENTTRIKGLKESAAADNKKLFEEYAAQPEGTRNIWATNKLRELNDRNYFSENPFKKSFDYITPDTVAKADKQVLVQKAIDTGDWSAYRSKFGLSEKQKLYEEATRSGDWSKWERAYGRSEKALARDKALASGDWSDYADKYGVSKKATPYQYDGKYFKSPDSMSRYKEGQFWKKYIDADKNERRELLAANPQYNRRSAWTDEMWDADKKTKKEALVAKARGWGDFASTQDRIKATSTISADKFITKRKSKTYKTKWA